MAEPWRVVLIGAVEMYFLVAVAIFLFVIGCFWRSDSEYKGPASVIFAIMGALIWPYAVLDWVWRKVIPPPHAG